MLAFSVPPGYRRGRPPARPKLDPYVGIIDRILEEDKGQPSKQRHTSKRIFERLRDEHGYTGGITIVKDYVRERHQRQREMFVPLRHDPGHVQVDFGEALAVIGGVERKIHFFAMDLPHSDGCLVQAYPSESSGAFCEGHNASFEFFGGVPRSIPYNSLKLAVARIPGQWPAVANAGLQRAAVSLFVRRPFRTTREGQRQGQVEGLVGYARRNFMVPVPHASSFTELNARLLECCRRRLNDRLRGHDETISERLVRDRGAFLPLPATPYEA
jgi:transposase